MEVAEFTYAPPPPLVIEFDPPVVSGPRELSGFSLSEPTTQAVFVAEAHFTTKNGNRASRLYQRALVAKVSGVSEVALYDIPVSDFTRAARFLQDYVESGLPDQGADGEPPIAKALTINFDPPIEFAGVSHRYLKVAEPTLGQMAKADSALGDMSAQRIRLFQQNLVQLASGENALFINMLPISVLNRAASFLMGFSTPGRATST